MTGPRILGNPFASLPDSMRTMTSARTAPTEFREGKTRLDVNSDEK
jgi:hypothetical protein